MYIPKHFCVEDDAEKFAFIEANNFGQLISAVDGRLFSTHLPFLLNAEKTKLIGHLARLNPQHDQIVGQEILVTFQGAHDYVSPSWFSTAGVPTWNYQTVHLYGNCEVLSEPDQIASIVDSLTDRHESDFDKPWRPLYSKAMLSAIVGIEITITEIQGKNKLSQNRVKQDQIQIKEKLGESGSHDLAKLMNQN